MNVVDLFCGAGGFTCGFIEHMQDNVDIYIDRKVKILGIDVHYIPCASYDSGQFVINEKQDLAERAKTYSMTANLKSLRPDAIGTKKIDLLMASPECKHHSILRKPTAMNDGSRSLAWVVIKWAKELDVENIIIENVPLFERWGPLDERARPDKDRRGETFKKFIEALENLGYFTSYRVLDAHSYGEASTRKRLFICARKSGWMKWPKTTTERRNASDVVIHEMPGYYRYQHSLCTNTWTKVMKGAEKFGGEPFLISLRKNGRPYSMEEPIPTITASGPHVALVNPGSPYRLRMLNNAELADALGFPGSYSFYGSQRQVLRQIGNAVSVKQSKALCGAILGE